MAHFSKRAALLVLLLAVILAAAFNGASCRRNLLTESATSDAEASGSGSGGGGASISLDSSANSEATNADGEVESKSDSKADVKIQAEESDVEADSESVAEVEENEENATIRSGAKSKGEKAASTKSSAKARIVEETKEDDDKDDKKDKKDRDDGDDGDDKITVSQAKGSAQAAVEKSGLAESIVAGVVAAAEAEEDANAGAAVGAGTGAIAGGANGGATGSGAELSAAADVEQSEAEAVGSVDASSGAVGEMSATMTTGFGTAGAAAKEDDKDIDGEIYTEAAGVAGGNGGVVASAKGDNVSGISASVGAEAEAHAGADADEVFFVEAGVAESEADAAAGGDAKAYAVGKDEEDSATATKVVGQTFSGTDATTTSGEGSVSSVNSVTQTGVETGTVTVGNGGSASNGVSGSATKSAADVQSVPLLEATGSGAAGAAQGATSTSASGSGVETVSYSDVGGEADVKTVANNIDGRTGALTEGEAGVEFDSGSQTDGPGSLVANAGSIQAASASGGGVNNGQGGAESDAGVDAAVSTNAVGVDKVKEASIDGGAGTKSLGGATDAGKEGDEVFVEVGATITEGSTVASADLDVESADTFSVSEGGLGLSAGSGSTAIISSPDNLKSKSETDAAAEAAEKDARGDFVEAIADTDMVTMSKSIAGGSAAADGEKFGYEYDAFGAGVVEGSGVGGAKGGAGSKRLGGPGKSDGRALSAGSSEAGSRVETDGRIVTGGSPSGALAAVPKSEAVADGYGMGEGISEASSSGVLAGTLTTLTAGGAGASGAGTVAAADAENNPITLVDQAVSFGIGNSEAAAGALVGGTASGPLFSQVQGYGKGKTAAKTKTRAAADGIIDRGTASSKGVSAAKSDSAVRSVGLLTEAGSGSYSDTLAAGVGATMATFLNPIPSPAGPVDGVFSAASYDSDLGTSIQNNAVGIGLSVAGANTESLSYGEVDVAVSAEGTPAFADAGGETDGDGFAFSPLGSGTATGMTGGSAESLILDFDVATMTGDSNVVGSTENPIFVGILPASQTGADETGIVGAFSYGKGFGTGFGSGDGDAFSTTPFGPVAIAQGQSVGFGSGASLALAVNGGNRDESIDAAFGSGQGIGFSFGRANSLSDQNIIAGKGIGSGGGIGIGQGIFVGRGEAAAGGDTLVDSNPFTAEAKVLTGATGLGVGGASAIPGTPIGTLAGGISSGIGGGEATAFNIPGVLGASTATTSGGETMVVG